MRQRGGLKPSVLQWCYSRQKFIDITDEAEEQSALIDSGVDDFKILYPRKSNKKILELENLILNKGRLSYHKNDIYYICILSRANNVNNGMAGTRPDALYALTHKLVAENVLSKEEVKEILYGNN